MKLLRLLHTRHLLQSRSEFVRDVILVALTACSGALDAASYLRFHTFAANMTGNTVLLGLAIGGKHLGDAAESVAPIIAFAIGAFLATALGREANEKDTWPAQLLRPFGLEIGLLLVATWMWNRVPQHGDAHLVPLLLNAAAMGVQSGITRDLHGSGASTTYMTGTIARTAEQLANAMKSGFSGGLLLNGVSWIVYLTAAVLVGAFDTITRQTGTLLWIVLAIVVVVALLGRPLVSCASQAAE